MKLRAISTFYVLSKDKSKFQEQYRVVFVDISYQPWARFCSQPRGSLCKLEGKSQVLAVSELCSARWNCCCDAVSVLYTPARGFAEIKGDCSSVQRHLYLSGWITGHIRNLCSGPEGCGGVQKPECTGRQVDSAVRQTPKSPRTCWT